MTRKEEIIETAKKYYNPKSSGTPYSLQMRIGFITGAKWADNTFLDRACEWLKNNISLYSENTFSIKSGYPEITLTDEFETAFRQAMGGGAE